jgi:hypothetical protein
MGQDFDCGCRASGGAVYPCHYHEYMLNDEYDKIRDDKKYLAKVEAENKRIHELRYGKKLRKVV